jgi:hypothetical protein
MEERWMKDVMRGEEMTGDDDDDDDDEDEAGNFVATSRLVSVHVLKLCRVEVKYNDLNWTG